MKKLFKYFFTFSIFFIIIGCNVVKAKDITVDEVIYYMNNNNILKDDDYFRMFGKVLEGNDKYNITDFSYSVNKEDNNINIKVTIDDYHSGKIEKKLVFTIKGNVISYINENTIDSLESRIATIMLSQLIYSVGGARGYDKDILIDWMNQIDLETVNEDDGIDWTYEKVTYKINQNDNIYEYEIAVPKTFSININKLTEKLPTSKEISVYNINTDINSISMTISAPNHLDEMCNIYRRNDNKQYEKIGQVSCNDGVFVDEQLKDETTYYYQVTIDNEIMCADDIEITTEKIPITGTIIRIGFAFALVIIGVLFYAIYNKKSLFRKI